MSDYRPDRNMDTIPISTPPVLTARNMSTRYSRLSEDRLSSVTRRSNNSQMEYYQDSPMYDDFEGPNARLNQMRARLRFLSSFQSNNGVAIFGVVFNAVTTAFNMISFIVFTRYTVTDPQYAVWRHISGITSTIFTIEWLFATTFFFRPKIDLLTIQFWLKTLCWPCDLTFYILWLTQHVPDTHPGFTLVFLRGLLLPLDFFRVARYYRPSLSKSFRARATTLAAELLTILLLFSAVIFQSEARLFPQPGKLFTYFDSVYLVFISCTTVGFGDETAQSELGRFFIVCAIVTMWFTFTASISKITTLRDNSRSFGATEVNRIAPTNSPIVICTDYVSDQSLVVLIEELVRQARRQHVSQPFVLFSQTKPSEELKNVIRQQPTRFATTHVIGDIIDSDLANKRMVQYAHSIVIPCSPPAFNSPINDDCQALMTALKSQSINSRARIFLQTHAMVSPVLTHRTGIGATVAVDDLRLRLMASALTCPGIMALIQNLICSHSFIELSHYVNMVHLRALLAGICNFDYEDRMIPQLTVQKTHQSSSSLMGAVVAGGSLVVRPTGDGNNAAAAPTCTHDLATEHDFCSTMIFYAAGLMSDHYRVSIGVEFQGMAYAQFVRNVFENADVLVLGIESLLSGKLTLAPDPDSIVCIGDYAHVLARGEEAITYISGDSEPPRISGEHPMTYKPAVGDLRRLVLLAGAKPQFTEITPIATPVPSTGDAPPTESGVASTMTSPRHMPTSAATLCTAAQPNLAIAELAPADSEVHESSYSSLFMDDPTSVPSQPAAPLRPPLRPPSQPARTLSSPPPQRPASTARSLPAELLSLAIPPVTVPTRSPPAISVHTWDDEPALNGHTIMVCSTLSLAMRVLEHLYARADRPLAPAAMAILITKDTAQELNHEKLRKFGAALLVQSIHVFFGSLVHHSESISLARARIIVLCDTEDVSILVSRAVKASKTRIIAFFSNGETLRFMHSPRSVAGVAYRSNFIRTSSTPHSECDVEAHVLAGALRHRNSMAFDPYFAAGHALVESSLVSISARQMFDRTFGQFIGALIDGPCRTIAVPPAFYGCTVGDLVEVAAPLGVFVIALIRASVSSSYTITHPPFVMLLAPNDQLIVLVSS